MKILERNSGFVTVGGMGCGPVCMDVCGAEDKVECNDGSILYVSLCWVSEAPEWLDQYISKDALLDALLDEDSSDESADRMAAVSGFKYAEEQLTDEEFEEIVDDVRKELLACFDRQEGYKGMFKEDAFTDDWDYDEAMEEYEAEQEEYESDDEEEDEED